MENLYDGALGLVNRVPAYHSVITPRDMVRAVSKISSG